MNSYNHCVEQALNNMGRQYRKWMWSSLSLVVDALWLWLNWMSVVVQLLDDEISVLRTRDHGNDLKRMGAFPLTTNFCIFLCCSSFGSFTFCDRTLWRCSYFISCTYWTDVTSLFFLSCSSTLLLFLQHYAVAATVVDTIGRVGTNTKTHWTLPSWTHPTSLCDSGIFPVWKHALYVQMVGLGDTTTNTNKFYTSGS